MHFFARADKAIFFRLAYATRPTIKPATSAKAGGTPREQRNLVRQSRRRDKPWEMLTTYEAVLRDNLLEWRKDAPRHLAPGKAVHVHVTVLDEIADATSSQGARMAAALEMLAEGQALSGVETRQWERETRTERPLPGRDA